MKKSAKRTMSLALALALTAGIAAPAAAFNTEVSAMEYQSDEYSPYSRRAEWINDVKWDFDEGTGTLTISGSGIVGYRYSEATFPWKDISKKVKKVVVKKGITELGDYSCGGMSELESVVLPEGLDRIDHNAFLSCDKLKSINLPASLTVMDEYLSGRESLKTITVNKNNKHYKAVDNVLYTYDMKALLDYPCTKTDEVYNIPEGVEQIGRGYTGSGGLCNNNYIKKIVMPSSMRAIYGCSFFRCRNLKDIVLNEGLETIVCYAFEECYALESIEIPSTVKMIDHDVFLFCKNLKTVKILSKDCVIKESRNTLPLDADIYGYAGSTTEKYIKKMGGIFVDIETGKKTNYASFNSDLVSQLPVNVKAFEPHCSNVCSGHTADGDYYGFQTHIYHESNTDSKEYKELLSKTKSIIKNCKTDYDKAVALTNWVNQNTDYKYATFPGDTIDSVYDVYYNKSANCMGKSLLLEYMLYLAGIPNAHITSADHSWSAALVNGKWLILDPTNYQVSYNADEFDKIEKITFTAGTNTYDIHNNTGVYLSGISYSYQDREKVKTVNIPSYVKNIYPDMQKLLDKMVFLSCGKKTIKKGSTVTLKASGRTKGLKWTTKNSKVAKVVNGRITAVGKGTTYITVKNDLGKYYNCKITVN